MVVFQSRLTGCSLPSVQGGGSALTVASQYGRSKAVDTLLKNGANVNDQLLVRDFSYKGLTSFVRMEIELKGFIELL